MTINNILYYVVNVDLRLLIESFFPIIKPLLFGIGVIWIYVACQDWMIDWIDARTNRQGLAYKIYWILMIGVWIILSVGCIFLTMSLWHLYQLPDPHLLKFDLIKK